MSLCTPQNSKIREQKLDDTDQWTDIASYRVACTRLKMTVYSRGLLVSTNFDRVFCCFEACRHFLVACALLVGWSIGQLVGMSIGLLVADCSGHATYGNGLVTAPAQPLATEIAVYTALIDEIISQW